MFWKRILELCYERKTSPSAVCAELGLSNATATKWKKGAIPRGSTLNKLADYFGVSVGYLLNMEEDDAEFVSSLPVIMPKQELPAEIEALNTLLYNYGDEIFKANDKYYFVECGELAEDELNDLINTVAIAAKNAVDSLVAKKNKKIFNYFGEKKTVQVYRAARSTDNHDAEIVEMDAERLERLKNAPDTDEL